MYPDEQEIKHMAEYVARWTFRHLIQTTDVERVPSSQVAAAAADRYAQALTLALSEMESQAEAPLPTRAHAEAAKSLLRDNSTSRDPNARPIRTKLLPKPPAPPIRCCTATFQTVAEWQAHASPLCRPVHLSPTVLVTGFPPRRIGEPPWRKR